MIKWQLHENETTAKEVYEILKHHCLLPEDATHAAVVCNAAAMGKHYEIREGGEVVAHVFVGPILDGDSAVVDLVPIPRNFRVGFDEPLRAVLAPLFDELFADHGVRRITAYAPYSRSRTKRALCSLGFVHEGRIRLGAHFFGERPEDVRILGLLREEYDGRS